MMKLINILIFAGLIFGSVGTIMAKNHSEKISLYMCHFGEPEEGQQYTLMINFEKNTVQFIQANGSIAGRVYQPHYLDSKTMVFGDNSLKMDSFSDEKGTSFIVHNRVKGASYLVRTNQSTTERAEGTCKLTD